MKNKTANRYFRERFGCKVYRMTGDGARRDLIAPLWSTDKKRVLNMLKSKLDMA